MMTFDYTQFNKKGLKDVVKWLDKQALPVKEVRGNNLPKRENGFQTKTVEIEFESGQVLVVKAKPDVPTFFQAKLNGKVLAIRDYKQLDNEMREIAAYVKENEPKYAKNLEKQAAKAVVKVDVPKAVNSTVAEQTAALKAGLAELQGQQESLNNQLTEVNAAITVKNAALADVLAKLEAEKVITTELEAAIERAKNGVFESSAGHDKQVTESASATVKSLASSLLKIIEVEDIESVVDVLVSSGKLDKTTGKNIMTAVQVLVPTAKGLQSALIKESVDLEKEPELAICPECKGGMDDTDDGFECPECGYTEVFESGITKEQLDTVYEAAVLNDKAKKEALIKAMKDEGYVLKNGMYCKNDKKIALSERDGATVVEINGKKKGNISKLLSAMGNKIHSVLQWLTHTDDDPLSPGFFVGQALTDVMPSLGFDVKKTDKTVVCTKGDTVVSINTGDIGKPEIEINGLTYSNIPAMPIVDKEHIYKSTGDLDINVLSKQRKTNENIFKPWIVKALETGDKNDIRESAIFEATADLGKEQLDQKDALVAALLARGFKFKGGAYEKWTMRVVIFGKKSKAGVTVTVGGKVREFLSKMLSGFDKQLGLALAWIDKILVSMQGTMTAEEQYKMKEMAYEQWLVKQGFKHDRGGLYVYGDREISTVITDGAGEFTVMLNFKGQRQTNYTVKTIDKLQDKIDLVMGIIIDKLAALKKGGN